MIPRRTRTVLGAGREFPFSCQGLCAGGHPTRFADCGGVYQTLKDSVVFLPEAAHLSRPRFLFCAVQTCILLLARRSLKGGALM